MWGKLSLNSGKEFIDIASINKKDPDLPFGRHSRTVHSDSTPRVQFLALDHIPNNPRGGDSNKLLLQSELRWIFHLNATAPPGLNVRSGTLGVVV